MSGHKNAEKKQLEAHRDPNITFRVNTFTFKASLFQTQLGKLILTKILWNLIYSNKTHSVSLK